VNGTRSLKPQECLRGGEDFIERYNMGYWNAKEKTTIFFEDEPWEGYKDWYRVDCGCCMGTRWGGEYPEECTCNMGFLAWHKPSNVLALYPGGPLRGHRY